MPKDLAAPIPGITEYQLHYPKPTMGGASNNPPRDYKMWGELVRKYTEHLVQRYGRKQVSTWYFEVWNEPDILYWHGTPQDYLQALRLCRRRREGRATGCEGRRPCNHRARSTPKPILSSKAFSSIACKTKAQRTASPGPLDFHLVSSQGPQSIFVGGHVRMGLSNELQATQAGFQIVAKYPQYRHLPIIL